MFEKATLFKLNIRILHQNYVRINSEAYSKTIARKIVIKRHLRLVQTPCSLHEAESYANEGEQRTFLRGVNCRNGSEHL